MFRTFEKTHVMQLISDVPDNRTPIGSDKFKLY